MLYHNKVKIKHKEATEDVKPGQDTSNEDGWKGCKYCHG